MTMAKQIKLNYNGKEFTLEFNRNAVRAMEENGFSLDMDKPYSTVTQLFAGAFRMHHRAISADLVREIWDAQNRKEDLLVALCEMYNEPIAALMDEEEDEAENPTWTLVGAEKPKKADEK